MSSYASRRLQTSVLRADLIHPLSRALSEDGVMDGLQAKLLALAVLLQGETYHDPLELRYVRV